ncbi:MAG: cytochrome C [Desulfobacteraceae bacterium 4572_19]|nr:MAG: cytochrome C [Desulfobacteraceae bacterium 4572_19]
MTSKKELQLAYIIMAILLLTGVVCYAAFPPPAPDEKVRIVFRNVAGKVLFGHQTHINDYDIECGTCHHNLEDGDDETYNCGECHETESDDEDVPNLTDALHSQCIGCHEEDSGPTECASCHAM